MDIPSIQEISGGHVVGGHLVPFFEVCTGDEPMFSYVTPLKIQSLSLRKLVFYMKRVIIFGTMRGLKPITNGPKKLLML